MFNLRDYQVEIKTMIEDAFAQGRRSIMCQMPTGTGKTVVLSSIIKDYIGVSSGTVLVVAHRREILFQIKDTLKRHGLSKELEDESIVVESIQKLSLSDGDYGKSFSLVVIDEAHHAQARTYKSLWQKWPRAHFLGMTATPCRLKKEGFTDLFDKLICAWNVKRFIMEGWLADYEYVVIRPDSDMKQRIGLLKKRGADGDYQVKEMGTVMDNRACIEQLYDSYKRYADGRQGIIYAINREHAEHIREFYEDKGESIMLIDSSTPKKERDRLMEEYRQGKIQIFVNCEIAGEGVDVPNVSFIQMARPTLSLSKYLQQVGRGLRPNKDKVKTIILDNVGMYYMFGLPNEDRDWMAMFRGGQIIKPSTISLASEKENVQNVDYDEGHNLEMVFVHKDNLQEEQNKAYVNTIYGRHVLEKKGNVIASYMFTSTTGFVDGVVCFGSSLDGFFWFYDDNGTFLYKTEETGRLMPNQLYRMQDKWGHYKYCDLMTGVEYRFIPHYRYIGDACLIEKTDGWHLRNSVYDWIIADVDTAHTDGSVAFIKDKNTGIGYVVTGHTQLAYRIAGTEEDNSLILVNDLKPNGILVRKDGKFTFYSKNSQNEWIFKKWHKELKKPKVKTKTEGNVKVIGDSHEIEVFRKNGKYGWKLSDEVLCKPKFSEIFEFMDSGVVYVQTSGKNTRSILVDMKGDAIFDQHNINTILDGIAICHEYDNGEFKTYKFNPVTYELIYTHGHIMEVGNFVFEWSYRDRAADAYWDSASKAFVRFELESIELKNGILTACCRDNGQEVIAFDSNPDKFYYIVSKENPSVWKLRDTVKDEEYLYSEGSLPIKCK